MADLKTTAKERARLRAFFVPSGHYSLPNTYTQTLLDDLDTLLAENAKLRGEVAEQRVLLRWFLDGDDHTHEDDCGARGSHDLDVCRAAPCLDDCEGPHCACGATEMRARALAALEAP